MRLCRHSWVLVFWSPPRHPFTEQLRLTSSSGVVTPITMERSIFRILSTH
jgi:hypothetical protein